VNDCNWRKINGLLAGCKIGGCLWGKVRRRHYGGDAAGKARTGSPLVDWGGLDGLDLLLYLAAGMGQDLLNLLDVSEQVIQHGRRCLGSWFRRDWRKDGQDFELVCSNLLVEGHCAFGGAHAEFFFQGCNTLFVLTQGCRAVAT
jgi:hypothetical protein